MLTPFLLLAGACGTPGPPGPPGPKGDSGEPCAPCAPASTAAASASVVPASTAVSTAASGGDSGQAWRGRKVTIGEAQTGAEACDVQKLSCIGVTSSKAFDANGKDGGYFIPDCYTRLIKANCRISGGSATQYMFTPGKFALITSAKGPKEKQRVSNIVDARSNSFCLEEPAYNYAVCAEL